MRFAAGLILLGMTAGCGGGTGGGNGQQGPGLVGPAGGTVSSSDGKVTLVIPPNAVGVVTQFTIEPDNSGAPSTRIVGTVYDIGPTGTTFPAGALPQLTMPYPAGLDPATLTIGTTDNGQWVAVPGSQIDQASQTITVALTHLSPYAVLQPSADNQKPVVLVSGPSIGLVGQNLTFSDANSFDPDGDTITYAWTVDGTPAGTNPSLSHAFNAAGTYVVTLTVSDAYGGSDSASIHVVISESINQAPVALLSGPSAGTVDLPLAFSDANSFDPEGGALTYAWTINSVPAGTGPTLTKTFTTPGTYTVTLNVSDAQGASGSASLDVLISTSSSTNQPPIAHMAGPSSGTVGLPLTFSDDNSFDPDGGALTYAWTINSVPAGAGPSLTKAFTASGTYTVTLTVSDIQGASGSASKTVLISPPPNQAPIAVVNGPYAGVVGQDVTFSAAGSSDPNGDLLTYAWTFGDNTTGSGPSPTHAYATANTFTVTLTVTDPSGLAATASTTATITVPTGTNRPPTVSAAIPPNGLVLQNLVLNGSGSDLDGDTLTYRWDFGDGSPVVSAVAAGVVHEYQTAGTYTARLTVDDGNGGVTTATGSVVITLPTTPVAFPMTRLIPKRQQQALYLNQHAIELDGSGVPPLRYTIVSPPTHFPSDLTTGFDMYVNTPYQWWDPIADAMRLECRRQTGIPAYCYATQSSHAENTTTGLVADPLNRALLRSTVVYTPDLCYVWIGPLTDSFAFTVTDATGATSAPATVTINVTTNTVCKDPTH